MSSIKQFLPVTQFDARKILAETKAQHVNGEYVQFSMYRPRVKGVLRGYDVEYGLQFESGESSGIRFFFRAKLKQRAPIPWFLKDKLPLLNSKTNFLSFGWVKSISYFGDNMNIVFLDDLRKTIPKVGKELDRIVSLAERIDTGTYDIAADVKNFSDQQKKDSVITLAVLFGGLSVVFAGFYVYLRFFW